MARDILSITWIRDFARPYLRGFRAVRHSSGGLCGYWFVRAGRPPATSSQTRRASKQGGLGFFVGYLVDREAHACLEADPPECLVFAFVTPIGGAAHRRLVGKPGSLIRQTFEYIRWLTHRPPRFRFFDSELPAMVRHVSMWEWPREKYEHFSRNFFTETLAWLVRSGLVRKLASEDLPATKRREAAGKLSRKQVRRRR